MDPEQQSPEGCEQGLEIQAAQDEINQVCAAKVDKQVVEVEGQGVQAEQLIFNSKGEQGQGNVSAAYLRAEHLAERMKAQRPDHQVVGDIRAVIPGENKVIPEDREKGHKCQGND